MEGLKEITHLIDSITIRSMKIRNIINGKNSYSVSNRRKLSKLAGENIKDRNILKNKYNMKSFDIAGLVIKSKYYKD